MKRTIIFALSFTAACTGPSGGIDAGPGYEPRPAGELGGACRDDGSCKEGLSCLEDFCAVVIDQDPGPSSVPGTHLGPCHEDGGCDAFLLCGEADVCRPSLQIETFNTSSESITLGEAAELSWLVQGAAACEIEPLSVLADEDSGTLEVMPESSTTYRLRCDSPYASAFETAHVDVQPADGEPLLSLTVNGALSGLEASPDDELDVTWTLSRELDECVLTYGQADVTFPGASGQYELLAVQSADEVMLVCSDDEGTEVSATVSVDVLTFSLSEPQITLAEGQSPETGLNATEATISFDVEGADSCTMVVTDEFGGTLHEEVLDGPAGTLSRAVFVYGFSELLVRCEANGEQLERTAIINAEPVPFISLFEILPFTLPGEVYDPPETEVVWGAPFSLPILGGRIHDCELVFEYLGAFSDDPAILQPQVLNVPSISSELPGQPGDVIKAEVTCATSNGETVSALAEADTFPQTCIGYHSFNDDDLVVDGFCNYIYGNIVLQAGMPQYNAHTYGAIVEVTGDVDAGRDFRSLANLRRVFGDVVLIDDGGGFQPVDLPSMDLIGDTLRSGRQSAGFQAPALTQVGELVALGTSGAYCTTMTFPEGLVVEGDLDLERPRVENLPEALGRISSVGGDVTIVVETHELSEIEAAVDSIEVGGTVNITGGLTSPCD